MNLLGRLPAATAWLGSALLLAFVVLPLWYLVVLSLDADPAGSGAGLWPDNVTFDNYRFLSSPIFGFYPALQNSLLVSVGVTVVSLVVAVPAAYALARLSVPRQGLILASMLAFAFFPGITIMVPLSYVFSQIGWLDRLHGIGLAQLSFTVPLAVWFATYAFRQVPIEVDEAAMVDGASTLQRIVRIVLPMARPGISAAIAVVFVASWNDYLFASGLNRSGRSETLQVLLAKLPSIGFLGGQMAAGVLMCLPVALIIALLLQWLSRRSDQ